MSVIDYAKRVIDFTVVCVSRVEEEAILLAMFDEWTTVGIVRGFAKEAGRAVGAGPAWTPPYLNILPPSVVRPS